MRNKLRRLEKAMRGRLDHVELADGTRFWFEPEQAWMTLFLYFTNSLQAVADGTQRPEPPEILKAVAFAKDREKAFEAAYPEGITPWCPLDVEALIECGELVPRSLVAGRDADEPIEDLSE